MIFSTLVALSLSGAPGVPMSYVDGGASPKPFVWELPPKVVSRVDMPGITWSMGVPVKMEAVTVEGKIEDAMRFMVDSFVRQGLYIDSKQLQGPMVTGLDPLTMIAYTALFQPSAPGFVSIILGETNTAAARKLGSGDIVPLFPGGKEALRSSTEGVDTLIYAVPGASEDKVGVFYRDILPKDGFVADTKEPLTFTKQGMQVSIRLLSKDAKVSVMVTRRRAPPPVQP